MNSPPPTAAPAIAADSPASWRALAGCCLVAIFGVSALYGSTFGLMMLPLQQSLSWSRGDIAFSLTLMTLVGPAILPLVGWLIDHVRLRPLILWGVLLQSASLAGFGLMSGSVWVYYGLCLVMIVTASGASMLTLAKLLQTWFDKAFGRALGILFAVTTVGVVIHPQIVRLVLEQAGWREAFFAMGAMSLVFGGAAAWWLVHERRGAASARAAASRRAEAANDPASPVSMRAFLADRIWWVLAAWNMLFAFAVGGIMLHFAAMMQDRGLSLAQAASAMSLIGLGGFAGNLMAGWLIDRVSATRLARAFVLAPLAAAVMLYAGSGVAVAITAAVLLGLFSGGDHSLSAFLARRYFTAESFGRASATQQIATAFGGGISPWLSGLVHDRTGSYDMALAMSIGAFLLACVAAWLLPEQRHAALPAARAMAGACALQALNNALLGLVSRDWAGLLLAALVALLGGLVREATGNPEPLVLGLALALLMALASLRHLARLSAARRAHPPPGRLVDVGGYRIHVLAEGQARDGRPPVLWFAGGHAGGYAIHHLHRAFRGETRSILIDRPGTGWSDTGPFPRTTAREAGEVIAVLERSGERGPFVIAGHSFGGLLAANIARRRPDLVHALVLLDPTPLEVVAFGPPLGALREMGRAGWTGGFAQLFGIGLQARREARMRATPAYAKVLDAVREVLGPEVAAARAVEANAGHHFAQASIYRELVPEGLAGCAWDTVVYDRDLGPLPLWLVGPKDDNDADIAILPESQAAGAHEARRMASFFAAARERYLAASSRSQRVVAPAGSGHNFVYELPEWTITTLRTIIFEGKA